MTTEITVDVCGEEMSVPILTVYCVHKLDAIKNNVLLLNDYFLHLRLWVLLFLLFLLLVLFSSSLSVCVFVGHYCGARRTWGMRKVIEEFRWNFVEFSDEDGSRMHPVRCRSVVFFSNEKSSLRVTIKEYSEFALRPTIDVPFTISTGKYWRSDTAIVRTRSEAKSRRAIVCDFQIAKYNTPHAVVTLTTVSVW